MEDEGERENKLVMNVVFEINERRVIEESNPGMKRYLNAGGRASGTEL